MGLACLSLALAPSSALAQGDANESSCPNESLEGFTEALPDCRAYEQVTPIFKNGERAGVHAISPDGSRVLVASLGAFGGTPSDRRSEGAFYLLSRSGTGWSPSAVSPPASSFPASEFDAASPGLERTLWTAHTASQSAAAESLYVREADGAMVEVGPLLPPSATGGPPANETGEFFYNEFVDLGGESDDLSHVVFSLQTAAPLWPGDTTALEETTTSLYEFAGSGLSTPELVGVSDGETQPEGEGRLPAGELISDCATDFGSETGDTYNATSATGATVFFTAVGHTNTGVPCLPTTKAPQVSEVYARIAGYRTVALSEPTGQSCSACQTGAQDPAEFAGASEDGAKAFFLTEQELLPEARGPNLYAYDFNAPQGQHVLRVSTGAAEPQVQGVARVSQNGSHVYFVAKGQLTRGPRQGREGRCVAELRSAEKLQEEQAEEQEAKEEAVTSGAMCRPREGADNLYLYERDAAFPAGRLAFLATLSGEDSHDWRAEDSRPVQATPDGRFVVFQSEAHLTPGDESTAGQLFEYDGASEELVRVSIGQAGYELGEEAAQHNAALITPQTFAGVPQRDDPSKKTTFVAVSNDGATVAFVSAGALTEGALLAAAVGARSVYEYHSDVGSPGGGIEHGGVSLVSDGKDVTLTEPGGAKGALSVGFDASGEDLFFETSDALLSGDTDTQYDTYDARIAGGFAGVGAPSRCEGEACLAAAGGGAPLATTPASASTLGNVTLPSRVSSASSASAPHGTAPGVRRRCRRGFVKRKRRCVKSGGPRGARRATVRTHPSVGRAGFERRAGR